MQIEKCGGIPLHIEKCGHVWKRKNVTLIRHGVMAQLDRTIMTLNTDWEQGSSHYSHFFRAMLRMFAIYSHNRFIGLVPREQIHFKGVYDEVRDNL